MNEWDHKVVYDCITTMHDTRSDPALPRSMGLICHMTTNKMIQVRRLELGLSEKQVAETLSMSLDSYCDIEWHADEVRRAVELHRIKKLSEILGLQAFELLAIQCPFCSHGVAYLNEYRLPRNELIRVSRQNAGLSQQELGDRSDFQDYAIEGMERDPNYLEKSSLESVMDLATALKIPLQILLGIKCPKCLR
jgi:DNA-binding XRE family transcriptional regulator